MQLRIGLCDDTPEDLNILSEHFNRYLFKNDIELEVKQFTSGTELVRTHELSEFHIIMLDIEMPGQSGLELAKYLRYEISDETYIIFTTSYPEYMQDSFEFQPFGFLTKPITYAAFEKMLDKLIHKMLISQNSRIVVGQDGEKHIIPLRELIYVSTIKGEKQMLEYHFINGIMSVRGSISELSASLAESGFVSCARGLLINIRHIHSFNGTGVVMKNNTELPVSRRKSKELQKIYANHIIKILN